MPAAELALLTRQLSALLGAGVQLVDALGALSDQSARAATKRMLSQVRERVREGSSLADALANHRDIFSDLYIGMVRAGEQAAALEAVLDRLAEYSERQSEFVTKVRGALTYPIIMMCVGAGDHGVPGDLRGAAGRDDFRATACRAAAGDANPDRVFGVSSPAIGFRSCCCWSGSSRDSPPRLATPRGRRLYDTAILKVYYIGPTMIRIICARFARTLATLLASGVQLLPALDAVKGVVTNGLLQGRGREEPRQYPRGPRHGRRRWRRAGSSRRC